MRALFGLNPARLALAKPDAIVLHPGPMNRGRRDHQRSGRRPALGDPRAGRAGSRGADGGALPARRRAEARGMKSAAPHRRAADRPGAGHRRRASTCCSRTASWPPSERREACASGRQRHRGARAGEELELIELRGKVVCPGLIDIHVHLREPGQEDKETVATGVGRRGRRRLHRASPAWRTPCRPTTAAG